MTASRRVIHLVLAEGDAEYAEDGRGPRNRSEGLQLVSGWNWLQVKGGIAVDEA